MSASPARGGEPSRLSPTHQLPEAVKAVRTKSGLTQAQLASLVGISPNYMSEVESGRRSLGPDVLKQVAHVLNVPLVVLERRHEGADLCRTCAKLITLTSAK